MTLQNMVEVLKQSFPTKGEAELLLRIAWKQREFATKTGCLLKEYDFVIDHTTFTERHALEKVEIRAVKEIRFIDSSGANLDPQELNLAAFISRRYLYVTDYNGYAITSYPANLYAIRTWIEYLPPTTIAITDILDLEESLHGALLAGVMEDLCSEGKDLNAALYWNARYKDGIREGKRYGNEEGSRLSSDGVTYHFSDR